MFLGESLRAKVAGEWFDSGVQSVVQNHVWSIGESFLAAGLAAFVRLFSTMRAREWVRQGLMKMFVKWAYRRWNQKPTDNVALKAFFSKIAFHSRYMHGAWVQDGFWHAYWTQLFGWKTSGSRGKDIPFYFCKTDVSNRQKRNYYNAHLWILRWLLRYPLSLKVFPHSGQFAANSFVPRWIDMWYLKLNDND